MPNLPDLFNNFAAANIDETRISNTVRSAAWISATYDSLWDTLLTYGSEETEAGEAVDNAIFFSMNL